MSKIRLLFITSVRSILLNVLFNVFFFAISTASAHNFNKFLAATVEDQIQLLQAKCNVAIEWFIENKMPANPDKFEVILLDK